VNQLGAGRPDAALESAPSTNPWLYVFIAMSLAALRFWQVPFSHPADADEYLSHLAAIAPFDHVSLWEVFRALTARYRGDAPGWFPLGPLPLAIWLSGLPATAAKSIQYVLLIGSFGIFAFVVRKLIGSSAAAILAVILALCAWQFRTIHDPAIGTSFLGPWAAITVLAAYAFWFGYCESGKPLRLYLCYLALALVALNGPVAWGLGAVLAIVALRSERRAAALGLCAIVVAGAIAIVAAGPLGAPWQHDGGFVRNVASQLFAALPTSFRAVGNLPVARVADLYFGTRYVDDRFVLIPAISAAGWTFAIVSAVAAYLVSSAAQSVAPVRRRSDMLICGIGLWLVPALALGKSGEWQAGLPLGQAFDGVYFEYLGLAVVATFAIWHMLASKRLAARLVPSLIALAAFALSYGNARGDAYALAWSARIDEPNVLVARAAGVGFFDGLPEGAIITPSPSLYSANWRGSGIFDPKYALFDYTGRRYPTQAYARLGNHPAPETWMLQTPSSFGILVELSHLAGGEAGNPLVDRALGYTIEPSIWRGAAGPRRGVERAVVALRDGRSIDARRLCGPVSPALAFAPSRPALLWGEGFVPSGPYGYDTAPKAPIQSALGTYLTFFPKVFMADRGVATIVPSTCPPGTIVLKAVAVSWRPSTLVVRTPAGVRRFALNNQGSTFLIHIPTETRAPFRIYFSTDAPAADWETNDFRYERDRPVKRRIVVEIADLWESL
jgi:hypothetical protein